MYFRFVSPLKSGRRGVHMGIFQAALTCRDDVDMPAYLHKQLVEEIEWFKAFLPSPDEQYFEPRHDRSYHWESICWFKSSAKKMIKRAWNLKLLIEEVGMPICQRHTNDPGIISYQDKYQIVAYPKRSAIINFQ